VTDAERLRVVAGAVLAGPPTVPEYDKECARAALAWADAIEEHEERAALLIVAAREIGALHAERAALLATCDALRDAIDAPDRPCSGCGDMVSSDAVCGACWLRTFPDASALADERRKTIAEVTALLRGPADPGGTRPIGWARWSRREMADAIERAFADEVTRV